MTADQAQRLVTPVSRSRQSRLLGILTACLPIILGALFIEICFEAWVQELLGDRRNTAEGPIGNLPGWPKDLKNGLLILLVAVSLAKVALEHRWREFRTWADISIVALAAVMVVAGLLGGSPPSLIGEALFVYFRGAIIFYAWRAWNPSWSRIRPLLWIGGVLVGINVVAATVQMLIGQPVVTGMGWVDTTWTGSTGAGVLRPSESPGTRNRNPILGLFAFMVCRQARSE